MGQPSLVGEFVPLYTEYVGYGQMYIITDMGIFSVPLSKEMRP